jgi:hypothetical protein
VKPSTLRHVHAGLTVFWLVMAVPSILVWRDSVPYLVGVSVYALVVGHWSSWQGARAEQAADGDSTC